MNTRDSPRRLALRVELQGITVTATKHEQRLIAETGTGLDPTHSDKIFDAFCTTKAEGIGMGLSICRSIVEGHGGRLWAAPNPPHGCVFQFTIPAHHSPPPGALTLLRRPGQS